MISYLDLIVGQRLVIRNRGKCIGLVVKEASNDRLRLSTPTGLRLIKVRQHEKISSGISIYSYGSRNHGNRIHIRLELYDNIRYEIKKRRDE